MKHSAKNLLNLKIFFCNANTTLRILFVIAIGLCTALDIKEKLRSQSLVSSLFNVFTFPNNPCSGNNGQQGTCYTEEDCKSKGGTKGGTCAEGYGTCCVFIRGCSQASKENSTYFVSKNQQDSGTCKLRVCRMNDQICQLRLDFHEFSINGPSTSLDPVGTGLFGHLTGTVLGTLPVLLGLSQCLIDTFLVTNPSGPTPPTICGENKGQHMYVDSSRACNDIIFELGSPRPAHRQWTIQISQFSCDFENLAPKGCTQYFFDSDTGIVKSFNFDGNQHLANQDQNICIRRERGKCKICWTTMADSDFQLSGNPVSGGYVSAKLCCGYGQKGTLTSGFDCLIIPGALTMDMKPGAQQICGRDKGLVSKSTGSSTTICSTRFPFSIRFLSDQYEFAVETLNKGLQLYYSQSSKDCM